MEKFTYNIFDTIEMPTFVLSSAAHKHYGVITNIDPSTVEFSFNMNGAQEGSFSVKKIIDGEEYALWDKLTSFRYVYCPEHREYYKIDVQTVDGEDTTKQLTLTSAGEYELSNRVISSIEINNETDWEKQYQDYGVKYEADGAVYNVKPTIFYDPSNPEYSLLHRTLKDKAPNWTIGHVDESLKNIQRTFSASNKTIYDFLVNDVGKEIECLFKFDSVRREISAYDLLNKCDDCGERGEFTDTCTKCGSHNISRGYGTDTSIYISYENYSESMTVDGDEGSVKNCFYVTGGDDDMNANIRLCTPTMTNYIYNFSSMDYDDMPDELVTKLQQYQTLYDSKIAEFQQYSDAYTDAVTGKYWYEHAMMPRANSKEWKANTTYYASSNPDKVYIMSLPSWCYLECVKTGTSGATAFNAASVKEGEIIQDGSEQTGVQWKVVRNIANVQPASAQLQVIKDYIGSFDNPNAPHPVTFLGHKYPSTTSINNAVKNIAGLAVNGLFKVSVVDDDQSTYPITMTTREGEIYTRLQQLQRGGNVNLELRPPIDSSYLIAAGWTDVEPGEQATVFTNTFCNEAGTLYYNFTPIVDNPDTGEFIKVMSPDELTVYAESVIAKTKSDDLYCQIGGSFDSEEAAVSAAEEIHNLHEELPTVKDYWDGYIKIINENDKEDTYIGHLIKIPLKLTTDYTTYARYMTQCIETRTGKNELTFNGIFKEKNDDKFKELLTTYGLASLKNFSNSYNELLGVLAEEGIGSEGLYLGLYDLHTDIYKPYEQRKQWIDEEIVKRQATVDDYVQKCESNLAEMERIAGELDLATYLGETNWNNFQAYVREGTYNNPNYIAASQDTAKAMADAKELLTLATKELKKACELQYTLTDNLHNLLNTTEFKNFKDKFELGDFLFCRADDVVYKLRLIQVKYNYTDYEQLSVAFSNVTKIEGYFSDVQSVLDQARNIATSYNVVTHQVDKNNVTTSVVSTWMSDGLNAANAMIKNNNMEETTVDNRGLISRAFDDLTEGYSKEEVRVTHNTLQFTSDAWKTTELALGKIPEYWYFNKDKNSWDKTSGYGLISRFVYSGTVVGSQVIAGDIYSTNYDPLNKRGAHLDLDNGEFTLADGNITWNPNARKLDVDGYIVARSLRLVPHADTNLADVALSGDASDLTGLASVATSGNAADLNDIADYAKKADIPPSTTVTHSTDPATGVTTTNVITTEGTYSIYSAESSDGCMVYGWGTGDKTSGHTGKYFKVSKEGLLEADNAIIYGEIHATKGVFHGRVEAGEGYIAGWNITDSSIYNTNSSGNTVFVSNATNPNQDYLVVRTGNGTSVPYNYPFFVRGDGTLVATKATITGSITATSGSFTGSIIANSGQIGNWYIHDGAMYNTNNTATATAVVSVNEIGFGDAKLKSVGGLEVNEISGTKFWIHTNGDFGTAGTITSSGAITSSKGGTFGENVTASKNVLANSGTLFAKGATTSGSAANCRIAASGNDYGKIMISTGSSMKYKHAFSTTLNDELDPHKLYDIPIYQYRYQTNYLDNEKDIRYDRDLIGFIAEAMDKYYPVAVEWHYDGKTNKRIIDDWNERYIIPPMLKLVQEQHAEIEELKARLLKLEEVEK